jgi:hypothetical protein
MKEQWIPVRQLAAMAMASAALLGPVAASAENHALIMWIGNYGGPPNDLPGIDLDAANARTMALAMGVPSANIVELSNTQLTKAGMGGALTSLAGRIKEGDKVFIYYSGHGNQYEARRPGAKCTEALVTADLDGYEDTDLQTALDKVSAKASQVVMFNDSCFSGGAASKALGTSENARASTQQPSGATAVGVPKFLPTQARGTTPVKDAYRCGNATNKLGQMNLEVVEGRRRNFLYVAASSEQEVSFATRRGSIATLAWVACLTASSADANRSGSINAAELRQCAQREANRLSSRPQTITLLGDLDLPLSFTATSAADQNRAVDPAQALHDLRAAADKSRQVTLVPSRESLRIRQDFLEFRVSTDRDGYLYILQVGSDGKTFNLLFPNNRDENNYLKAGTHTLPRDSWRVRAGGPAGTSSLLALVSPVKRDLIPFRGKSTTFGSVDATAGEWKTLFVEASGSASGEGRYGASAVVGIRETE